MLERSGQGSASWEPEKRDGKLPGRGQCLEEEGQSGLQSRDRWKSKLELKLALDRRGKKKHETGSSQKATKKTKHRAGAA